LQSGEPEELSKTIGTIVNNLADPSHPKVIAYIGGRKASPQLCSGEKSLDIPNCAQVYLANPGLLDSIHILHTLEAGADAVFIAVQNDSHEHHKGTSDRLRKKVVRLQDDLEAIGLDRERVQIYEMENQSEEHVKELLSQGIERLVQFREE
jgi:coenzyme F420-reducing hydrogenase delta subunit